MNILLIQPSETAYGVLSYFTESLFSAFSKNSFGNAYLYKPKDTMSFIEISNEIDTILKKFNITHVFSFNSICAEHMGFIKTDAKFIGWIVDYPVHHENRLNSNIKNNYVISGNKQHSNFVHRMTKSRYLDDLTLGVNADEDFNNTEIKNRSFDVCIAGSWMGQPEKKWLASDASVVKKIGNDSLDELITNDKQDVFSVLLKNFDRHNIDLIENKSLMGTLIRLLIQYLRKYERIKIMKAAELSGLKILVVGEGWSDYISGKNIFFHESVPFDKLNLIYLNSKTTVCFNSNNGGCERAIEALSVGSTVFSFGGESIELLAKNNQGFCIQNKNLSSNTLAKRMNEWNEKIMSDDYLCHQPFKFIETNNWMKIAQILINTFATLDLESQAIPLAS
jgi:hypothetical protein